MGEFIVNPRRAPRAPARCRTIVASASGTFETETEDVGARGCQIVSPGEVRRDDGVRLTITNERLAEPLRVAGRIAWVSPQPPWRVGIAFDEGALAQTTAWFERLVQAHPGLRAPRPVPERIPMDAGVYLGPPPRFLVDFSADEAALLRAIGSGARVDELVARFRSLGSAVHRALFSLIARSAVTLVRGQAVHPDSWKRVLADVEASLAVESLGTAPAGLAAPPEPSATPVPQPAATPLADVGPFGSPAVATPVPTWSSAGTPPPGALRPALSPFGRPPPLGSLPLELDDADAPFGPAARGSAAPAAAGGGWGPAAPSVGIATPVPIATPAPAAAPASVAPPAPDFAGKGVGWRKASAGRSGEAQAHFDRARAEFHAGNVNGSIALLRRALALAPGDPEIAEVLGKLAFRDREPGAR